jgi:Kef-type K+ transport system membrane component KefB/mannitol/fructose-specific phosphotransferase system IIA component (Ntr-type)
MNMNIFPIHDPVLIFSIVLISVLAAPILAEKIKLPGIIGLIISGVIFGPHLFGILERDKTIELLGTIGLLYIMFQAGLEINMGEVKKNKHYTLLFGIFTFAVPLIMGILVGVYLLKMSIVHSVLFASMFSSHTLLTFPIVTKLGISKNRAVSTAIGGTIITDTLALLILAVIIKMNAGNVDIYFWIKMSISILIYTLSVIYFLPKITRWFFKRNSDDSGNEEYVFIFAVLFITSYLAHIAGLESIIGAFLAGVTLNRLIPEKSILMNRINFVGNALFIPFFLISVGMIIDVKSFFKSTNSIKIAVIMIIAAILSKYIAAYIFGKIVKFNKNEINLIFGLSVNQAAATLAAVLIAYEVGIFGETILSGTVMMIVATTFTGAFKTNKSARNIITEKSELDGIEKDERVIGNRILIPVKNPKNIDVLTDIALYIGDINGHEPIYALNVVLDGEDSEHEIEAGEELLTKVMARGGAVNRAVIPVNKIDTNISNGIIKSCKEHRITKIIIGWSGEGSFKNKFFGSVPEQFIKNSKEMVFLSRVVHKIDISRNIVLIVPPLINRQVGFKESLKAVMKIAKELNDKVILISDDRTIDEIKGEIEKNKKVTVEYKNIKTWKTITAILENTVSANDIIVQIAARQEEIGWRLDFEKLIYKVAEIYKNNNFIVIYPYSYIGNDIDDIDDSLKNETLISKLSEYKFEFDIREKSGEEAIDRIFKESKYKNKSINELKDVLNNSPIELSHKIVLCHIHSEEVKDADIYILVNKDEFEIKDREIKFKILILLFSPKDMIIKSHLEILSDIAKLARNKKIYEIMSSSNNYNEFYFKLQEMKE